VLDGAATRQVDRTDNGAGATEALAGAMAQENSWLQLLAGQKPRRNTINQTQWQELASVLEKLKVKSRYLCRDEILRGRALYDDYSAVLMPADSSGWITANRMDPGEIKLLAEKLRRFLTQRRESFHQELLQRDSLEHYEETSLEQDLSRIAILLSMLDHMSELTSLERERLINRVLQLVKPQEFELAQFRDMITQF
ncbi:MAG: hypothetical protein DRI61_15850, partial [Chloroflexi bacterium]